MIIFVPTIPGSGTFFMTTFLLSQGEITLHHLMPLIEMTFHSEKRLYDTFEDGETHLVHAHFGDYRNAWAVKVEVAEKMADRADGVVVPIRDPLLILLTNYVCNREYEFGNIINSLLTFAEWNGRHDMCFMPIDLLANGSIDDRLEALTSTVNYLGINPDPCIVEWAENWPVYNNSTNRRGGKDYREFYEDKDLPGLLPEIRELLVSNRKVLKPFLKEIGYKKLSWWKW
jgi:hypothetical protein